MRKLILALATSAGLYAAGLMPAATAMPISDFAMISGGIAPKIHGVASPCARDRCMKRPSYYDTPPELRPRVFYGYAPHRQGDWYEYYKGWFGYRKRWSGWW
jgi:hypothetical protein